MPELNVPPCPVHGAPPRSLHTHDFEGVVQAALSILDTVSGVGTSSYSRCPYGYPNNFEGIVRVLEDLNASISGIQGGGGIGVSGLAPGSGIYFTPSGTYTVINADAEQIPGAIVTSGVVPSGVLEGTLWYDEVQGRTFVLVSGNGTTGWYQTNAEALAYMSETPPSGVGNNAPPRDGYLWFNKDLGNMLVYDAQSSGWYETGPRRNLAFRDIAPTAAIAGEAYFDSSLNSIKVWNGSEWISNAASALPSVSTTTISGTVLNSYPSSSPGTRTYTVNVERGGEIQTSDIKFINTASDAYTSEFAVVYSSGLLASFSGEVSGGQVNLLAYSNTTDYTTFRPVLTTP